MRVGVTGGTGFIGQYLIRDYASEYDFIVPVRNSSIISDYANGTYVESDFSVESLKEVFKDCDAVVHLAGKSMQNREASLKMEDYMPSVVCAAHVFEACKDLKITNIICVSSRAVFGNGINKKYVLTEEDLPNPSNEYGLSKVCIESLIKFYNCNYNMYIKTYRIGEICGLDLKRGMINVFWQKLLCLSEEKKELPIFGSGNGGRDLIYIKDVTRALILGIENESASGIFNIGRGAIITNMEIAKMFCKVFSNEAGIRLYPEKEDGGTNWHLDVEKAKRILIFEARYDLFAIVEDIKGEFYSYERRNEL